MAKFRAVSMPGPAFGASPQLEVTDCDFKLGRFIMGGEKMGISKIIFNPFFFFNHVLPSSVLTLET
jgi:hypothetical protein